MDETWRAEAHEKIKKIAIKTAEILKSDICGVDILESAKGPLVIEANLSVIQTLEKKSNLLIDRIEKGKEQ